MNIKCFFIIHRPSFVLFLFLNMELFLILLTCRCEEARVVSRHLPVAIVGSMSGHLSERWRLCGG